MKTFNIAILGCGTVGGGVAKIIQEINSTLAERAGVQIQVKKIVELNPKVAAERFSLPINLFCGNGKELTKEDTTKYIQEIIEDKDIQLVVETIGGSNDFIYNLALSICKAKKHLVTANKALLAERGTGIFKAAKENNTIIGFEAAVCGAIPIIKTIKESFTGDEIQSISGIMNGTSNYILSMMQNENLDFARALKLAQDNGYAEADPTFDVKGYDAGHKLIILIKLAFGLDVTLEQLSVQGVDEISSEDIDFAREIDCKIKLICFAQRVNGDLYATVRPMMVKSNNLLSGINGAINAVKLENKYSGSHVLIGKGAGSSETASSIVADIVFIARYAQLINDTFKTAEVKFLDSKHFELPYIVTFETDNSPGITGLVTTAIGKQNINIDTVSHNRHNKDKAVFSIATMPCTMVQIAKAIEDIKSSKPGVLLVEPKIIPILY
jgi:homoserine dehydrogenase